MDFSPFTESCSGCPNRVVCRCLQVTESTIVEAVTRLELQTVREVRRHTGAGEGCTCCHHEIRGLIEQHRVVRAACA